MQSKVWRFVGMFVEMFDFVQGGGYVLQGLSMLFVRCQ